MQNAIILLILIVAVLAGVKQSLKHFRGEGGCCGGASSAPARKKLSGKVIKTYVLSLKGLHCSGCVNTVSGIINGFDGAACKVSLRKGRARIRCDRAVDINSIISEIQRHGYEAELLRG